MVKALAFDLGASSGRAVVGQLDGERLSITETHRFLNEPVSVKKRMYWDILRLFHEVKQGLLATRLQGHGDIQSLGIDAWGVDFGLIGRHGELLGNPYHYRDSQTNNIMEEVWQLLPREEIFTRTGIQFMQINTIYQLYALKKASSPLLEHARSLLMIPELLRYFLTGSQQSEWSIASTSQLCNPFTQTWDTTLLEQLGLPTNLFLLPSLPGTHAGDLLPSISHEVGLASLPVIAVAEHDTASAVAAIPAGQEDFAYLSSGTWSLIGTELPAPIINKQALAANVTNEGGIGGTTRLLKNVTGLWLLQECRRAWRNEGKQITLEDEVSLIEQGKPFQAFINPDHPMFLNPPHMPQQIQSYCQQTGQTVPENEGDLLRCIVESLALRYRFVLERIEQLTQKHFPGLYVVGGGSQHTILCQYTANALARPIWAGLQEATAIGNLLLQFLANGSIRDIQHGRSIVQNSFPMTTYEPTNVEQWEKAFEAFVKYL